MRLIETDSFAFEFLSRLAERESWRKEVHRPVYHVHKWWATRLGSIFRGILLGATLPANADLAAHFYQRHSLSSLSVFDPFMGSGTTVGEAHKLGFSALGRDINPVAVEAVSTALGPMDRRRIREAFDLLSAGVGKKIRALYRSTDSKERPCDVLYYFSVMRVRCPNGAHDVDLFPSYAFGRNAAPRRRAEVQIVCPACGDVFPGLNTTETVNCPTCAHEFNAFDGPARGAKCLCQCCDRRFTVIDAIAKTGERPKFRQYAKLVLTRDGRKEYLRPTPDDLRAFQDCTPILAKEQSRGAIQLPELRLERGYNTRQAMNYGFCAWRDFFNDRQLLALGWLRRAIAAIDDESVRWPLMTLFSGILEFNNLFASYKGEGTGAVRHMFSHHILKPERMTIEANVWGTRKSSGSFLNLFQSRLLRAIDYRETPTEVNGKSGSPRECAPPFSGEIGLRWPTDGRVVPRGIYLSCGDSAATQLPDRSIDIVVTDPPFFDNVHYSELADFFYAWQQLPPSRCGISAHPHGATTRRDSEVQDSDAARFADKLKAVFCECRRILKDDGLLVFTYHHSRDEGWHSLAESILGAGFVVVNAQPVKAELSVATPKFQAKEPIQLDIIIVCRKQTSESSSKPKSAPEAMQSALEKMARLRQSGFSLSRNDRKIILYGQLLTTLTSPSEKIEIPDYIDAELDRAEPEPMAIRRVARQKALFTD